MRVLLLKYWARCIFFAPPLFNDMVPSSYIDFEYIRFPDYEHSIVGNFCRSVFDKLSLSVYELNV